jgi:lysophospholipase L1-like esterase
MSIGKTAALWLLAALTCLPGQEHTVKIVLVGDSTVNDEGGWGPGFRASFDSHVDVLNLAKNGKSTRDFRALGLWAPALAAKPDYILVQFGHNDGPGKGPERETDPKTTYRENLARYVAEARAIGAIPVLVTSIVRRNFTPDGKFQPDSLVPYVDAVRQLAADQAVPLLDLYSLTQAQAEQLGPAGCDEISAVGKDGKPDHTHLGLKGRQLIGAIAARELIKVQPALKPYFVGGMK